jgi:phage terminase large subunit-like protein
LTTNPAIKILYISSTSTLAIQQLKFIKDILTSDIYRHFWPNMINKDEAKREKWAETAITVDHPLRKELYIRDPSIYAVGLGSAVTGFHPDLLIFDDLVVYDNAYTEEGRRKVALQCAFLASVESAKGEQFWVGTHYDPNDEYMSMKKKVLQLRDDKGNTIKEEPLYDVFERQVENRGDGYGEFLWPRQKAPNGMEFGFDSEILANKRALYQGNETQFYAQYYNNPNMGENAGIPRHCFQYYSKEFLRLFNGVWYYKDKRLNVFAAIDFAYTTKKSSDYTAIVVVGVDSYNNYYVLDIDRFKSGVIEEYYDHILKMHQKWGFWQLTAECTAAQAVVVNDLKINYIRPNGLGLTIKEFKPHKYIGAKEERMDAVLRPRYLNGQMWHYLGGWCQTLEEELMLAKPPHDDIKDTLTTALISAIPPTDHRMHNYNRYKLDEMSSTRFGGIG